MDKFDKNALIALAIMAGIIIAFFYIGYAINGTNLGGADDKVAELAQAAGGGTPHASLYTVDQNGEYVGFGLIGVMGGFFTGYIWVMAFDETSNVQGQGTTEVTRQN
jgi:hypothetical protein